MGTQNSSSRKIRAGDEQYDGMEWEEQHMAQRGNPAEIDEVMAFWFAQGNAGRWFKRNSEFDLEVKTVLGGHYQAAASGAYEDWSATPRGCVALCILLDQVPRNLFRGDPRAFATDELARAVTQHALSENFDRQLSEEECLFLYLPLEHSESLKDQERCCELMTSLQKEPTWHDYALRHRDIIARFGRFPHRNEILGRKTTEAEEIFLRKPGTSF